MKTYTVEGLFDIDKYENDEQVVKLTDLKAFLKKVDVAFEMVRISWDKPTPQATSAINEAWEELRELQPYKK